MKELIIGGSGFLGSKLVSSEFFEDANFTYLNQKTSFIEKNKNRSFRMNLVEEEEIFKVLLSTNPSLIIHCGGITDTDLCEREKEFSWKVNVEGTENLMRFYDGKIIYFSTDYVFDGKSAPYNENSKPNPINHYGITKLKAEEIILKRKENLVVRVSGLYGINKNNNKFINRFIDQDKIYAYTNIISSPTYIEDIVNNIQMLTHLSGIIHLSNNRSISRYNFTKLINDSLHLSKEIISCEYKNKDGTAKRPYNSSLTTLNKEIKTTPINIALAEITRQ
jgi:dTDP-4-dehydrorhamnose reductase